MKPRLIFQVLWCSLESVAKLAFYEPMSLKKEYKPILEANWIEETVQHSSWVFECSGNATELDNEIKYIKAKLIILCTVCTLVNVLL